VNGKKKFEKQRLALLPLYRQSAILEGDAGVSISRATMDGWVMRVGEMLIPKSAAIGRELLGGGYIQADETPVPVEMHGNRGKNHQAYLWQFGRPGGSLVFNFRMGRGREGPGAVLDLIKEDMEAAEVAALPSSALGNRDRLYAFAVA
jgi:hypothetical protein